MIPVPNMGGMPVGGMLLLNQSKEPPARVKVAMELLGFLTAKSATRAVANSMSIQEIDGQKPTIDEERVRVNACNLLIDYFKGKLNPDFWETFEARLEHGRSPTGIGIVLRCFVCGTEISRNCVVCGGSGRVLVFPSNEKSVEEEEDGIKGSS